MSVHENLEMGAFSRKDKAAIGADFERVYGLFPRLQEREQQKAGTLSGGEQQMLAIGRALMAAPKLLLLDEPSMGLAPILVEQIFDIIETINQQGTTVLLVEQNALMALAIANRGYILQTGEIVLADEAASPRQEPGGPRGLSRRRLTAPTHERLDPRPGTVIAAGRPSAEGHRGDRDRSSWSRSSSRGDVRPATSAAGRAVPARRRLASPDRAAHRAAHPNAYDFLAFGARTSRRPAGSCGRPATLVVVLVRDADRPVGARRARRRRPSRSRHPAGSPGLGEVPSSWPTIRIPVGSFLDLIGLNSPIGYTVPVRHPQPARRRDVRADAGRHRPIPVARPLHDHRLRGGRWRRSRCRPGRPATTASTSPSNPGI